MRGAIFLEPSRCCAATSTRRTHPKRDRRFMPPMCWADFWKNKATAKEQPRSTERPWLSLRSSAPPGVRWREFPDRITSFHHHLVVLRVQNETTRRYDFRFLMLLVALFHSARARQKQTAPVPNRD